MEHPVSAHKQRFSKFLTVLAMIWMAVFAVAYFGIFLSVAWHIAAPAELCWMDKEALSNAVDLTLITPFAVAGIIAWVKFTE